MVSTIATDLQQWTTPDSPPLDLMAVMRELTLNVLTRALFGIDLLATEYAALVHALRELLEQIEHSPGAESALILRDTPTLAVFDASFDTALVRCRQHTSDTHSQASLLAMLIDAVDASNGQTLSESQFREELLLLSFVGVESIAAALAQAIHLLIMHPTVLAKLQAEVDEVLQGELPTLESVNQLVYAGMVLQETLRLHPLLIGSAAALSLMIRSSIILCQRALLSCWRPSSITLIPHSGSLLWLLCLNALIRRTQRCAILVPGSPLALDSASAWARILHSLKAS